MHVEIDKILLNLNAFPDGSTQWVFVKYVGDVTEVELKLSDKYGNVIHVIIPKEYTYCFGRLYDDHCYIFQIKKLSESLYYFCNEKYFNITDREWVDETTKG